MPKLLKSLFPARDDKKELRPSPHNQQVSGDSVAELSAEGIKIKNVKYIITNKLC